MEQKIKDAVETLAAALSEDKSTGSYYYSWQANIAMAFYDEAIKEFSIEGEGVHMSAVELHAVANIAAKRFLDSLCHKPIPDIT
jgi:hypothetical protein